MEPGESQEEETGSYGSLAGKGGKTKRRRKECFCKFFPEVLERSENSPFGPSTEGKLHFTSTLVTAYLIVIIMYIASSRSRRKLSKHPVFHFTLQT